MNPESDPTKTPVRLYLSPTSEIFLEDLARVSKTHPGQVVDQLITYSKLYPGLFLQFMAKEGNPLPKKALKAGRQFPPDPKKGSGDQAG